VRWLLQRLGLEVRRSDPAGTHAAQLQVSLEFVVAHRLQFVTVPDFLFVQIGAYDGVSNDPLHDLVVRHGLSGILVEPQREAFERLQRNYAGCPQLEFVNAAIAWHDGETDLYRVRPRPGLPAWAPQAASMNPRSFGRILGTRPMADSLERERVRAIRLDTLLHRHGVEHLDLLQIDTEGFDYDVIKMIPFERLTPHIIQYEHKHLAASDQRACAFELIERGYRLGRNRVDTIAYLGPGVCRRCHLAESAGQSGSAG
jgi:FkbM family methyltransferase